MSGRETKRPRWLFVLDRVSVAACLATWSAAVVHLAPAFANVLPFPSTILVTLLGIIAGYLLADFVSGSVHWIADRYFDPETPILGPALIAPFREHHEDALAMTRHDFFEVSGNNGLATIPLALGLLLQSPPESGAGLFAVSSVLSLGLFVVATNQFHCWAHVKTPPRFAGVLQRAGLILSPNHHAAHHRGLHDRAYCVTSGWLNPLLDRIQFFRKLDLLIARIGPEAGTPLASDEKQP